MSNFGELSAESDMLKAESTTLSAGLEIESALYYSSFSLVDCREGIAAFLQKRAPSFEHR
jgi:enoyl-CoA hydratase